MYISHHKLESYFTGSFLWISFFSLNAVHTDRQNNTKLLPQLGFSNNTAVGIYILAPMARDVGGGINMHLKDIWRPKLTIPSKASHRFSWQNKTHRYSEISI